MKTLTIDQIKSRARSLALRRHSTTIYVPATDHMYFDGLSYRVRVTRDGYRTSKNFKSFRQANRFKNNLLSDSR